MRKSIVFGLLVLTLLTQSAVAQTDIFGSVDTVRLIAPFDGASFNAGASIPISIELFEDWEFEKVVVWVGGYTVRTFTPTDLIQFEFETSEDHVGSFEILVIADLADENQRFGFAARSTVTVLPSQPPVSLVVNRQDIRLPPDAMYTERISVEARFSDGSTHTVSQKGFGISFEPLTQGIVAVAADGEVTAIAEGETLVQINYKGLEDWAYVAVYDRSHAPPPYPTPRNISSDIAIDIGPFRRDLEINRF